METVWVLRYRSLSFSTKSHAHTKPARPRRGVRSTTGLPKDDRFSGVVDQTCHDEHETGHVKPPLPMFPAGWTRRLHSPATMVCRQMPDHRHVPPDCGVQRPGHNAPRIPDPLSLQPSLPQQTDRRHPSMSGQYIALRAPAFPHTSPMRLRLHLLPARRQPNPSLLTLPDRITPELFCQPLLETVTTLHPTPVHITPFSITSFRPVTAVRVGVESYCHCWSHPQAVRNHLLPSTKLIHRQVGRRCGSGLLTRSGRC